MAGFGGRRHEAAANMVQQGLTKSRARGNQRHVPAADRLSRAVVRALPRLEQRDRVGHGLQVVQETHARDMERLRTAVRRS